MNIFESIVGVMSDMTFVPKTQKNQQQGYNFRGIDAVMNALNPALIKNKVFVVPTILEQQREERTTKNGGVLIYSICKIKYTFYAEDGTNIECVVVGEGMDSGDKATNKAMAIALKYAFFQVFCIPTEEMQDPDLTTHEIIPKQQKITVPNNCDGLISEAQLKRMHAIANKIGISAEHSKKIIEKFGYPSSKLIAKVDYEEIIKEFEKWEV